MDQALADRLNALNKQALIVKSFDGIFRTAEATKNSIFAQSFLKTDSSLSNEVRKNLVHSTLEWQNFMTALAEAETNYNFEKMYFDILKDAYYAELNTFKRDYSVSGRI